MLTLCSGLVAMAPAGGSAGAASAVALPSSMASVGDSITRAFDIDPAHFLQDSPQYSWSTGTSSSVDSQYDRVLAANPAIKGHVYNDAKSGAQMSALDGQLKQASGQHVQYATVLMGANDVCTSSVSTMTPTATFKSEFGKAMADFFAADPSAHVLVASIPNIYHLWSILHTNSTAQSTWSTLGLCQSMLSSSGTATTRSEVQKREVADNAILASVCATYANCLWDKDTVYNVMFPASYVSTADYFHPDLMGQKMLAAVSWGVGYWPSTP
ncbi:MAG TPA: GDSL-type esterase/lipase family protein [Acidimicrobiales bacterium]|nr:GDSL-type esterase/lipase family protein [Acidimicrobiales bacterium]